MTTHIHLFNDDGADDEKDGVFVPVEELDENFTDIGNLVDMVSSESNRDKLKSTLKHINFFLRHQSTFPWKAFDEMSLEDHNDSFAGALATYFGRYARKNCNIKNGHLAYLSSYNYMSGYKNLVLDCFKDQPEPAIFSKGKWGKYLRAIFREKSQQAKKEGKVSSFLSCVTVQVVHIDMCKLYISICTSCTY